MREDGLQVSSVRRPEATIAMASTSNTQDKQIGTVPMVEENTKTPEQTKATNNLQITISDGNATYNESNLLGDIASFFMDKNVGNYIVIEGLPEGITLGEIKSKYNLPDGSLRHMVISGGGSFDAHTAPTGSKGAYFYVYDNDLAEGLGISTRELKDMFPETQFSPWYKLGTNE